MKLLELHRSYRKWASNLGQKEVVILFVVIGLSISFIKNFVAIDKNFLMWRIMPWLCLFAGPIAAFDAWGAAMYRGESKEAKIRAAVLIILFWGFTFYALLFREASPIT